MYPATFLLLSLFPAADPPAAQPSIAEIEKAVLTRRRSIRRGMVSLEAKIWGNHEFDEDRFTTIWFDYDKNKIRSDVVNHWKNRDEPTYRIIQCFNCERPNYWVEYQDKPLKNATTSITLEPLTDEVRKKRISEIFDPRMLGLVANESTALQHYNFQSTLDNPNRENLKLRRDHWKGADCWVISFRINRRADCELWIVPSQGYNVARSICESLENGGKPYRVTVETEAAPVGNSGLWFPHTCTYEAVSDGKLSSKEELRITKISLNEPIDDKVFTLAGMDIAPGTGIAGKLPKTDKYPNGEPRAWTWTGDSVVDYVKPTFIPEPPSPSNRGWLIATAVTCAVVATAVLVVYFRRGRLKPSA